jgi:peptidyl-prolyl cis-trans isomerase SurA
MRWQRLLESATLVVAVSGCGTSSSLQAADSVLPPQALVMYDADSTSIRSQKPDGPGGSEVRTVAVALPGASGSGVRARVNGVPILDSEVTEARLMMPNLDRDKILEQLIDRELLVKDAETKLRKVNKMDVIDKVKEFAKKDFQKWIRANKAQFKTDEEFKAYLLASGTSYEGQLRFRERMYIADEYMRSNIGRWLEHATGREELYDYYTTHPEEFTRVDSVQWMDIFIDASKQPNRKKARERAEEVAALARRGDDFRTLCMQYDDGVASQKKGTLAGMGDGTKRDNIRPTEAARILFSLRDGEVGNIIELPTGFHVVKLIKRENAGLAPFDEKAQQAIREKLRNEVFVRESKRFVEDLRNKSNIERYK